MSRLGLRIRDSLRGGPGANSPRPVLTGTPPLPRPSSLSAHISVSNRNHGSYRGPSFVVSPILTACLKSEAQRLAEAAGSVAPEGGAGA